jgi:ABC-type transport system involved in cytochrome c biogenesis permease subunit
MTIRLTWLVGVALLVLVINVAVSILYMVAYGHLIDPGREEQYYQDHIKIAAPYCSIIAGIPLMFFAGRWVGGWWGRDFAIKAALVVWLTYALIDITVLLATGLTPRIALLFTISFLTKLAAVYFGALGTIHRDLKDVY